MIAKPLMVSTIKNETAFSTGVELNRIREYKSIGKVGSDPIKKIVVFIFEKLNIKATTKAPIIAGRRKGIVTYHQVNGHTDDVGDAQSNQTLSESRAKSVYQYLLGKGIETSRVLYKGYGETQPIADNASDEGKAQNRRTEFVILQ